MLKKAHEKYEMGGEVHESVHVLGVRRAGRRRERSGGKVWKEESGGEDEKGEVEKKVVELKRIVPGGASLGMETLFEETAGYILALENQVKTMRVLASFFEGLEKERRKLGG
ncbi:hypothetical protein RJ639_045649 [Escallonia herrerae]|uniref:Transcription factor PAR2 n=1 Tax=Escallonia herrerae TaxID=1293975 RepID=A0AA88WGK3_9ASTE|nr:hypothetical protein RJ639_045649 [Escallonia herrerae]